MNQNKTSDSSSSSDEEEPMDVTSLLESDTEVEIVAEAATRPVPADPSLPTVRRRRPVVTRRSTRGNRAAASPTMREAETIQNQTIQEACLQRNQKQTAAQEKEKLMALEKQEREMAIKTAKETLEAEPAT